MFVLTNGERIIKVVRRHWFVILGFAIGNILLAILPFIFYKIFFSDGGWAVFFLREDILITVRDFVSRNVFFVYPIWILILWIIFFVEWTDYYLDTWVITDRRVIDIEQRGFFNRHITSCNYNQVQDITVETKGFLATLFKFGTLHVHTAGSGSSKAHDDIVIHHADKPEEIRALLVSEQIKSSNQNI